MIRRTAIGALLVLPVVLVSCQRDRTQTSAVTTTTAAGEHTAPGAAGVNERDNALVRVVHAMPAGAAIDVWAGDTRVFAGVAYKEVAAYHEVPGERHSFKVRLPDIRFDAGQTSTMVVVEQVKTSPRFDAFIIADVVAGRLPT